MDAIVTAGGIPQPDDPLYNYSHGDSKALIDVAGKPMIQWVLDALSESKNVDNVIVIGALSGADTILIDSEYRVNWPPRDKYYVNEGAGDIGPNKDENLPGGWTLNGATKYSQVKFLPAGTRMQYYFKAVDINGGVSYQFTSDASAREVEDLPYLPGSSIRAPDIIEFNILPRKYPAGASGSLASGKTDADVLNLDGSYLSVRDGLNRAYYGKEVTPADIIIRRTVHNKEADRLREELRKAAK